MNHYILNRESILLLLNASMHLSYMTYIKTGSYQVSLFIQYKYVYLYPQSREAEVKDFTRWEPYFNVDHQNIKILFTPALLLHTEDAENNGESQQTNRILMTFSH